ncbi:MAG: SDR family oxidoreductase [Kordiimonadaceae bacterium]|jgi:NAD(P)-dependent dehydrogenase (short-subunit alcohol dehydrogenase family)|nr:SDR family oxidoreductase [Kordiimonadaceae bacterium]MBT6036190.1 SDR family oxidoreductase [Kordiimonadaceae bacterium]MBT6329033.1 SDR family oxidoreductase [Kordiimonadaceae bacterium]MBT7581973.1 SDR family oxidoreductase [Kordiimonadaceae bacterium]
MTDGVLVTAGNNRIGRKIAERLSQAGFYIYLHHHDSEIEANETLAGLDGQGESIMCDLSDYQQVEDMIAGLACVDNPLKHIINNASLFSADQATDFNEQSFAAHMNINLRSPMQLARGLDKMLENSERGSVVNILDSKVFSLNADFFSYTLSKHGLFGATEMMAQALSPKVRVNGIAPGLTLISESQSDENFELASHLNFVGAPINVNDIANSVLHLINSASINGAVLPVDGGQKMMNFTKDVVDVATGILEKNK